MARVVIADDSPGIRRSLRRALKAKGHDVVEAANGEEALDALRTTGADLLVTDIVMPGKEGLETISEVRDEFPDLPIIAVSGVEQGDVYLRIAELLGAEHVFRKPVDPDELHDAITKAVGPKQQP